MAYVLKNISKKPIPLGANVDIDPGEQLDWTHPLTDELWQLHEKGELQILNSDMTFAERKTIAEIFTPKH